MIGTIASKKVAQGLRVSYISVATQPDPPPDRYYLTVRVEPSTWKRFDKGDTVELVLVEKNENGADN